MYIQSIAKRDPELWCFPAVYRALEDREVSPEQFLKLFVDEVRLMRDRHAQSMSLAKSGDIALAGLIAYGTVDAAESTDFRFASDLQMWQDLIQGTLDELRTKLNASRSDLSVDVIDETGALIEAATSWVSKYRYDRAANALTECGKLLQASIEEIKKDQQVTRDLANEMSGRARNFYQERAPIPAGVDADSLARQILSRLSDLTLASRPDLDQVERLTSLVIRLCELQREDEVTLQQVRIACEEAHVVSLAPAVVAIDDSAQAAVVADQILMGRLQASVWPQSDPAAWLDREILLDVGVSAIDAPVYVDLLLRTDMSLCLEPSNDQRVSGQARDRIELEIDKQLSSLLRDAVENDRLEQQASRLLRAAKAALLSFPTGLPSPEQSKKIRDYLVIYSLLCADANFSSHKFASARDYYLEAFRLQPKWLRGEPSNRVPNYIQCLLPDQIRLGLKDNIAQPAASDLGDWMEYIASKVESSNAQAAQAFVRGIVALYDVEDLRALIANLLSKPKSCLAALLHKSARRLRIDVTGDSATVLADLYRATQDEQRRFQDNLAQLIQYTDPHNWPEAYRLAKIALESPSLDNLLRQELVGLREWIRDALEYPKIPRFEDRDTLFRRLRTEAHSIADDITKCPTSLSRCYVYGFIYRMWGAIEATHEHAKIAASPILQFSIAKVHILRDSAFECHTNIVNVGETTAEQIQIEMFAPNDVGIVFNLQKLPEFSLAPSQTRTLSFLAKSTIESPNLEAFDASIKYEFVDRDRKQYSDEVRIRVDLHLVSDFVPLTSNPYVTGGIVRDERVFVGRDRLIDSLLAELANSAQTNAAVILGQMRSGKTSILYHLQKRAPESVLPVMVSLHSVLLGSQQEDLVARLFDGIANALVEECDRRSIDVEELDWDTLVQPPGAPTQFERWLRRLSDQTHLRPLIMLDEFTELLDRIEQGFVAPTIMKKFKQMIEQGRFSCVISGIDQMADMISRYANELMVSNPRWIGYLDPESARQLIEDPIRLQDGRSRFASTAVVEEVVQLTAGNPYLIQLICNRIVTYINDSQVTLITLADLEKIINSFIRETDLSLFHFLCRYKEDSSLDNRSTVLEGLVLFLLADETQRTKLASQQDIAQRATFVPMVEIEQVIDMLQKRRVIEVSRPDGVLRYRIVVDLFCKWLAQKRPMDGARLQGFQQRLEACSAS